MLFKNHNRVNKKGVASFGGEGAVFPPLLTGSRRPDEYGPVHGMGSLLSY